MLAHLVVKLCLVVGKNEGKAMKLKFLDFDLLLFQILSFAFIYVYLLRNQRWNSLYLSVFWATKRGNVENRASGCVLWLT